MPKHQNIRSNNLISHLSNFQKSERGFDFLLIKTKNQKKSNLIFLTSKKIKNHTRYSVSRAIDSFERPYLIGNQ